MSIARLALQVGTLFCLMAAFVGAAAELTTFTIIWRSLLVGTMGTIVGALIGGLITWFNRNLPAGTAVPIDDPSHPAGIPAQVEDHGEGG